MRGGAPYAAAGAPGGGPLVDLGATLCFGAGTTGEPEAEGAATGGGAEGAETALGATSVGGGSFEGCAETICVGVGGAP